MELKLKEQSLHIMIYNVIGLMSGTSLDGLDIAYCCFEQINNNWSFKILKAETVEYTPEWKQRLATVENALALEFVKTHVQLGHFIGKHVHDFIERHQIKVDFIASHGHTIFHQPALGYTSQIGDGNAIVAETGLPVVCDFRSLDVALGGQGAPLVPIGDRLLFHEYDFCLNLGGISNISYQKEEERIAFDISPCNMALNELAGLLDLPCDYHGENARNGELHNSLFEQLNSLEFYKNYGPKSLGKEWYLEYFRLIVHQFNISVQDKLRTVTEHIAHQISSSVENNPKGRIIVTGGGAFNTFLIERLDALSKHTVIIPDTKLINYKEALIFAFLGVLRMEKQSNCLSEVTGASIPSSGGSIMGVV